MVRYRAFQLRRELALDHALRRAAAAAPEVPHVEGGERRRHGDLRAPRGDGHAGRLRALGEDRAAARLEAAEDVVGRLVRHLAVRQAVLRPGPVPGPHREVGFREQRHES